MLSDRPTRRATPTSQQPPPLGGARPWGLGSRIDASEPKGRGDDLVRDRSLGLMWGDGWMREPGEKEESAGKEETGGLRAIQSFRDTPGFRCPLREPVAGPG